MELSADELDLQIGVLARTLWRLRETYESQLGGEATLCIKLTSQWNVEVFPRNNYRSDWRIFGAAGNLADAVSICLAKMNKSFKKED